TSSLRRSIRCARRVRAAIDSSFAGGREPGTPSDDCQAGRMIAPAWGSCEQPSPRAFGCQSICYANGDDRRTYTGEDDDIGAEKHSSNAQGDDHCMILDFKSL